MPRIRTIKPDFYRHHDLYLAEEESKLPIRVAFSGLWLCADKEGRFKWNPVLLKLDVLPHDKLDFSDVLEVLKKWQFIEYYEVEGKKYGWIPTFKDHQRITGSEATTPSKIPCPPITYKNGNTLETTSNIQGIHLDDKEGEGKGREMEKEMEGKGSPDNHFVFKLQKIYDKTWEQYDETQKHQKKTITQDVFFEWKKFVDFIWDNNFQDIFKAKFVSPIDFATLITEKGFLQHQWKPVIENILSTGVNENQNLFFRIPQFIKYHQKNNGSGKTTTGTTKFNAGAHQLLDQLKGKTAAG